MIIYEGPSELTGDPIVAIATGVHKPSFNPKTGAMVQIWIMRSDMHPYEANKTGQDDAICGDCKLRNGACYVTLPMSPAQVYYAYINGVYEHRSPVNVVRNRHVRIGAYGDGAALPEHIFFALTTNALGHTCYTHQWKTATHMMGYSMASVDTIEEYLEAKDMGWHTFRSTPFIGGIGKEVHCPAKPNKYQCIDCLRCDGKSGDIFTQVHGTKYKVMKYHEAIQTPRSECSPHKGESAVLHI